MGSRLLLLCSIAVSVFGCGGDSNANRTGGSSSSPDVDFEIPPPETLCEAFEKVVLLGNGIGGVNVVDVARDKTSNIGTEVVPIVQEQLRFRVVYETTRAVRDNPPEGFPARFVAAAPGYRSKPIAVQRQGAGISGEAPPSLFFVKTVHEAGDARELHVTSETTYTAGKWRPEFQFDIDEVSSLKGGQPLDSFEFEGASDLARVVVVGSQECEAGVQAVLAFEESERAARAEEFARLIAAVDENPLFEGRLFLLDGTLLELASEGGEIRGRVLWPDLRVEPVVLRPAGIESPGAIALLLPDRKRRRYAPEAPAGHFTYDASESSLVGSSDDSKLVSASDLSGIDARLRVRELAVDALEARFREAAEDGLHFRFANEGKGYPYEGPFTLRASGESDAFRGTIAFTDTVGNALSGEIHAELERRDFELWLVAWELPSGKKRQRLRFEFRIENAPTTGERFTGSYMYAFRVHEAKKFVARDPSALIVVEK